MQRFAVAWFLTAILAAPAAADRCQIIKEVEATSQNGRFRLTARRAASGSEWLARLEDTETKRVTEGSLGEQSTHPHLALLIPDDGSRIVLFETRSRGRDDHRVQVFDRDFQLLKDLGFKDLLTEAEQAALQPSVSHLTFTATDPEKGVAWWLENDGKTFTFRAISGRRVSVSLEPNAVKA